MDADLGFGKIKEDHVRVLSASFRNARVSRQRSRKKGVVHEREERAREMCGVTSCRP
jgi:hypothetical protein